MLLLIGVMREADGVIHGAPFVLVMTRRGCHAADPTGSHEGRAALIHLARHSGLCGRCELSHTLSGHVVLSNPQSR